jgi:signal transduction histidine kinase/ActR/RegA family two-component response regulator
LTVYLTSGAVADFRQALLTKDSSLELRADIAGRNKSPIATRLRARRLEGGRRILWIAREEESALPSDVADLARALRDKNDVLEHERRERERLERESRAKDRFLAILSHDLRAPLNAVLGWTDLLRRELLDRGRRERALVTIDRNARALLGLVEELLDISRINAGRMQLDVQPLDVSNLVRRVVDATHPSAREKGLVLGCAIEEGAIVVADTKRVEQCVTNLLSNALKFTPSGGRIDVSVTRDDDQVTIAVKDTGAGIAQAELLTVFDCFQQGDDRAVTKGGLGLGLFIVRQIAHLHGGTARAESDGEGRGATFTVELPVADRGPAPADSGHAVVPEADLTGMRVLVVDDDADTRELMTALLGDSGAHVASAADVASAALLIESWRPDAVISDLSMRTHEDGLHVVRAAREQLGEGVIAIAMSGFASERDAARSLGAGFDAHLAKPLAAGELISALLRLRDARS